MFNFIGRLTVGLVGAVAIVNLVDTLIVKPAMAKRKCSEDLRSVLADHGFDIEGLREILDEKRSEDPDEAVIDDLLSNTTLESYLRWAVTKVKTNDDADVSPEAYIKSQREEDS